MTEFILTDSVSTSWEVVCKSSCNFVLHFKALCPFALLWTLKQKRYNRFFTNLRFGIVPCHALLVPPILRAVRNRQKIKEAVRRTRYGTEGGEDRNRTNESARSEHTKHSAYSRTQASAPLIYISPFDTIVDEFHPLPSSHTWSP